MKFIFEVLIDPDHSAEAYAAAWVEASRIIQQAPGARGTFLHRDMNDPNRLLAIATWESKTLRDAAEGDRPAEVKRIIEAQAEHVRIRVLGEFDDPEWRVVPGEEGIGRGISS